KTVAGRVRDFPNIHSASPAQAGRHERVCGCSHSHRRRRLAPCRTPGGNLSPALDLDVKPLEPGPHHLPPIASSLCLVPRQTKITIAWGSGVQPCRCATGQGISTPTVCQWCIGPLDGDVLIQVPGDGGLMRCMAEREVRIPWVLNRWSASST